MSVDMSRPVKPAEPTVRASDYKPLANLRYQLERHPHFNLRASAVEGQLEQLYVAESLLLRASQKPNRNQTFMRNPK